VTRLLAALAGVVCGVAATAGAYDRFSTPHLYLEEVPIDLERLPEIRAGYLSSVALLAAVSEYRYQSPALRNVSSGVEQVVEAGEGYYGVRFFDGGEMLSALLIPQFTHPMLRAYRVAAACGQRHE
jgi:hypothetical protein